MPEKHAGATEAAPVSMDSLVDVMAPLLGLTISPEQRPGVIALLDVACGMARLVFSVPLRDDTLEMAAAFRPGAERDI